jgi:hypothetical protein
MARTHQPPAVQATPVTTHQNHDAEWALVGVLKHLCDAGGLGLLHEANQVLRGDDLMELRGVCVGGGGEWRTVQLS